MKFCQSCGLALDDQESEDLAYCTNCIDSDKTTTSVRESILNFWNSRMEVEKEDVDS